MLKNARIFNLRERYLKLLGWLRQLNGHLTKLKSAPPSATPPTREAETLWLESLKRQIQPPD